MTVWAVSLDFGYDGEAILGVFLTEDAARERAARYAQECGMSEAYLLREIEVDRYYGYAEILESRFTLIPYCQ